MDNPSHNPNDPDRVPETTVPRVNFVGRKLGDFQILRLIGQGGMGQVYLAEQASLKRKVALKLMRQELMTNPVSLQRFKYEGEAIARVTHPNIVQVYQIGQEDGLIYMVLEYVDGRNLREYITRKGPLNLLVCIGILRQVANALQRASETGIIHRDIKAENILLTRKGEVKVADFGLSRILIENQPESNLTQSGIILGTPLYLSPEQIEDRAVDTRTDLYSLGITAYFMLTGKHPYVGKNSFEIALRHLEAKPVPLAILRPDLPEGMSAIVARMMAKDPQKRYQMGRDLVKDLVRLRESLNQGTNPSQTNPSGFDLSKSSTSLKAPIPTVIATVIPNDTSSSILSRYPLRFLGALALATLAGLGSAWMTSSRVKSTSAHLASSDTLPINTFVSLDRREQALARAADEYLNSSNQKNVPLTDQTGFGVCLDLGLFYLEHKRYEEADRFFLRLEQVNHPRYSNLGKMGKGIVLALTNHPEESNQLFVKLFLHGRLKPGQNRTEAENLIALFPSLRVWFFQALIYNNKNGIQDLSWVPKWLVPYLHLK